MPETLMKSTTVRALRTAMGTRGACPGLGARWVDRLWFSVPRPRPTKREFRPTTCHLSSWSVERRCAVTAGETTRRSST